MGLNDPLWLQYLNFLWDAVRLDSGNSLMNDQPISRMIANTLPHTVCLTVLSVLMGLVMGIPLGVIVARNRNRPPDSALRIYSLLGHAIPDFYLAAVLLVVFSLTLAMLKSAFLGRLTRTSLLEVFGRDDIRTARAKGAGGVSPRVA